MKKSGFVASFQLLNALSDLDGLHKDLTEQDKKIMCDIDSLFEGVTSSPCIFLFFFYLLCFLVCILLTTNIYIYTYTEICISADS